VGSDGERHQDGNDGQHSAAGRLHVCGCTACRLAATEDFCFARLDMEVNWAIFIGCLCRSLTF
jgi:hypothetical protein